MKNLNERFPLYSKVLRLYPRAYRERYADEMLQTLADMLDGASSRSERLAIWARAALDLPLSLLRQQFSYTEQAFAGETPQYVRRNAGISATLFVPFFLIVLTNDATAHSFYHTWLWSFDILLTWIIILPALGLIVSAITLIVWLYSGSKRGIRPWYRGLIDFRHNWPMLILTLLGTSILLLVIFHDTTQCITYNPIRAIHNPTTTLRCIENHVV